MQMSADPKLIKALALDLDGTLLGSGGVLSEKAITVIKKCMQKGLQIIISTGRSVEGAELIRASLGAGGPQIYCNGVVVADMPEGKILKSTLMDKKAADFCIEVSRDTGIYCQVYLLVTDTPVSMSLVTDQDWPGRELYKKQTGVLAELRDFKEALYGLNQIGCVKTMFVAEPEFLEAIKPRLTEHLGSSVYMTRTQRNYLELMNPNVSKGQGLKFIMEQFSLKKNEVIAFGDDENDMPMSEAAGFFVAPSNAKDKVKEIANLIVGPNTDDGIAAFLEEFFAL